MDFTINLPVLEALPQQHYGDIPRPFPRNSHVMDTLEQVMDGDISILPLVCIKGARGLTFQPRVLPDNQAVHIRNHKRVFHAPVLFRIFSAPEIHPLPSN